MTYLLAISLPFSLVFEGGSHMQMVITFMAVVAGLVFSIAVALVVEEMIFGQVFRIFFSPQPQPGSSTRPVLARWGGQPIQLKSTPNR